MLDETMDAPAERPPRKLSRDARRAQLIDATVLTLADLGFARTTLSEVARRAGLSHGLVNFHFATKEGLLSETLRVLADEYQANWEEALSAAPPEPGARLAALLLADFEPRVCTHEKLSAWVAFWGEAQARPLYQANCSGNDDAYVRTLESICAALVAAEGVPLDPVAVARVLRVTTEGVWLDMMTMTAPYARPEAIRTVMTCATAFFPRRFTPDGLRPEAPR